MADAGVQQRVDQRVPKFPQRRRNRIRSQPEHATVAETSGAVQDKLTGFKGQPRGDRTYFRYHRRFLHAQEGQSYMELRRRHGAAATVD